MFTGIVSDVGRIVAVSEGGGGRRISVASAHPASLPEIGASIALAGVCLTVVEAHGRPGDQTLDFDAAPETLAVTTAATWRIGTRLNVERALRVGDELGGHFVLGHVDGVARITARDEMGTSVRFVFSAPGTLARFIAAKGSVALDGTSLTVNAVAGEQFECLIIPHTLTVTTWGERRVGDDINLEVDTLARYLARLGAAG